MPNNITDVDAFTDPVTTVADTEAADAAHFALSTQALSNRTRNLKNRLDVLVARIITAGAGLTGGGDLSADRTLNVIANADASIVVNANDIQVGVLASDAQHGVRGGGTQHAAAVASGASGFITGTDKAKLDGIAASAAAVTATAPVDVTKAAAAVGVGTTAARHDHKHDVSTAAAVAVGTANAEGSASSLSRSDHVHALGAAAAKATITAIKTSGYTAAIDELVRVDSSGGAVTITLPTAVGNDGRRVTVKKIDAGTTNNVTLDGAGAETIDGTATVDIVALTEPSGVRRLISDGAGWLVC